MKDCVVSESVSKKTVNIECDCPVTFEYIIEWEEQHPDIHITPMSGEIKALSKTPIELLYRPSTNTTASATFKLTTTEFNSKPEVVRVVGSATPGTFNVGATKDHIEIEDYGYNSYGDIQEEDQQDSRRDTKTQWDKPKTLLTNKSSKYSKRPGSGVKLKKLDTTKLSTNRGAETGRQSDVGDMVNTMPNLKKKLTPEELDFITKYRQLEELDKTKEIKMFRCLGDPPITGEEIDTHKQTRVDYIDGKNMEKYHDINYTTELDTDIPEGMNPQLDLYQNNHFELRK